MYQDTPPPYELVVVPSVRISSVDFWPRCRNYAQKVKRAEFEDFDSLIGTANTWLQDHPDCEILNCESLKKKAYTTVDVYDGSTLFRPVGTSACMMTGLRLWFCKRNINASYGMAPQFIAYLDVVPACLSHRNKNPQFELLSITLDKLNARLMQRPLDGKIITVETVVLDIPKDIFDGNIEGLTHLCCLPDRYKKHKLYYTRIFYLVGEPRNETIGVADFIPDQIGDTGIFHGRPEYKSFSSMFEKASTWVSESRGIRVTNIQTLDTRYWKLSVRGQRLDTVNSFDYRVEERHRVLFLRVAYVRPMDPTCLPNMPTLVSCRTFLPKKIRDVGCCSSDFYYEDHGACLRRIQAWVNAAGARVLCAETVMVPEWFVSRKCSGELTVYHGDWYFENESDGNQGPYRYKMINIHRVYVEGEFLLPNPVDLPAPPIVETECTCAIL